MPSCTVHKGYCVYMPHLHATFTYPLAQRTKTTPSTCRIYVPSCTMHTGKWPQELLHLHAGASANHSALGGGA
eukprot:1151171-Pelagomonas_calceolata.AAC.3